MVKTEWETIETMFPVEHTELQSELIKTGQILFPACPYQWSKGLQFRQVGSCAGVYLLWRLEQEAASQQRADRK